MRVRGKGFKEAISVSEALKIVLDNIRELKTEKVSLDKAHGRVLARDIIANIDVPPFDRAAMDGYAVRAKDTFGASQTNPIYLKLKGEVRIGESENIRLEKGECVRISTGAPLPDGADAVVMYEYSNELDGEIEIIKPVTPGENVSFAGEDIERGKVILKRGNRLNPYDLVVLASLGMREVEVYKIPKCVIISTGNELVEVGDELRKGKIYESTSYMLSALIKTAGGYGIRKGIVRDVKEKIKEALEACLHFDMIIITGGSSVGLYDLVPDVVSDLGELFFHGINVRPGKPTGFGIVEEKPIFILPGNSVASFVAFESLIRPALQRMQGQEHGLYSVYPKAEGTLIRKIPSEIGRRDFVRVKFDGKFVEPIRVGGAGIISTLVKADGFVVVPENVEGFEKGEKVEVRLFLSSIL